MNVNEEVEGHAGFSLQIKLGAHELAVLQDCIREQYLSRIADFAPDQVEWFNSHEIGDYHKRCDVIDHAKIWNKSARILSDETVQKLRSLPFMAKLEQELGPFEISAESGLRKEEIYWRLVRPGREDDVGPVHADRWFWDLGNGETPEGVRRVKIWIAVVTQPGRNGLQVVPGSHQRDYQWHGESRDGIMKPVFDEDPEKIGLQLPEFTPGQAIVFNDNLLHAGAVNQGDKTRVSVEFTMFTHPKSLATSSSLAS